MEKSKLQQSNLYSEPTIYDQMHTQGAGKDFNFYKSIAEKAGKKALEMACGTGRLTIPLAKAGINMTGIDISEKMLSEARRKAELESVTINWIQADCCHFSISEKFPFIFIPCNSFHHIYEIESIKNVFDCVKVHLEPDGFFALDIYKPDFKILSRDPSRKYHVMKYINSNGVEVSVDEMNLYNPLTQVNEIKWFHTNLESKVVSTHELIMRQFFPEELKLILMTNGFQIVESYGSWDMEPISDKNFKQILVCKMI